MQSCKMDLTSESVKEFKLRAMFSHGTTRRSVRYKTKLGFLFNFDFTTRGREHEQ